MRRQILFAGTGGQGVVWLGRVVGEAARDLGLAVIAAETHGMAQRGGSVTCHLKLGGYRSPVILAGRADLLVSLDAGEAVRYRHYLAPGGAAVVNAVAPAAPGEVDGLALAAAAGAPRGLNAAVLGVAAALTGLDPAALRRAVAALSPDDHRDANLRAFDAGRAAAP
ncbi:MAG: 2-oxoacid:acceptor oxidoreductase family protein [Deferrisomatales bacterium]